VAAQTDTPAVDALSVEAWVRTSSTQGGRIVGFTDGAPGTATTAYDRVLYLTSDGRAVFGVRTPAGGPGPNQLGVRRTVESAPGLADGQWHHVVGTLGAKGMRLFVDGVSVASRNDTTGGQQYYGHWQVGADTLAGWPSRPGSDHLTGLVDEVAVYHLELTPEQVAAHVAASGRPAPDPPG
jgi:large repetitive protein